MGLGDALRKAIDKIQGAGTVDKEAVKEAVKEIQRALISSNVDTQTVFDLSKKIEEKAFEEIKGEMTRREHIVKITYDSLVEMLGGKETPQAPKKILLCGLFGSGKTTGAGKLGLYYTKRGKKVAVIAGDVYRPAAYEQLETNAKQAGIDFFGIKGEKNAAKVVKEALKKLKGYDLLICDSAGRSALDNALVKEIKEIDGVFEAEEKWLVIGADIGNLAKKQAQAFHNAVGINGVIITRMDGSSKGGGALVACNETGASVYFISTGEKLNDFEAFDANRYLSRIMGYGDLEGLLEKAREAEIEQMSPEQMLSGNFNFRIFYEQLKATKKIGPLNKIAEMLGLSVKMPKEMLEMGEEKLEGFKVIIDSMTEKERLDPELLSRTRVERIAKGSGKKIEEVRELVKQFKTMKKMFKKFKGFANERTMKKMGERDLAKMMQQMQGKKAMKKFRLK
ncbi:MAG: signal recognition particle receptor subunit alpha [Candidatus Diapherotrites archaeon]|nr:signal recognition particle receptor subunit alpha [Candidatus Diapherotrites archaeon]